MLADPTPQSLRGKIAWAKFRDNVRAAPIEVLRQRAQEICSAAFDIPRQQQGRTCPVSDATGDTGVLADRIILESLRSGALIAFAYLPAAGACYRLKPECWQHVSPRVALDAIRKGVTPMPTRGLPPQSLECELADRPLFSFADAEKALLKLHPPAMSKLNESARTIIAGHKAETAAKMLKPEFVALLIQKHPGCSKQLAEAAWAKFAPAAWRRPGRPPRA